LEKEKVSPITKTKINKTLYDDIQCNEYSEHNLCEKFSKNVEKSVGNYACEFCHYNTAIKVIMTNIYRLKNIQKLCSQKYIIG
jgi:hypothetical protein